MPEMKIKYLGCFYPDHQEWTDFVNECLENDQEPKRYTDEIKELEDEIELLESDLEEERDSRWDWEERTVQAELNNDILSDEIEDLKSNLEEIQEKYKDLKWRMEGLEK